MNRLKPDTPYETPGILPFVRRFAWTIGSLQYRELLDQMDKGNPVEKHGYPSLLSVYHTREKPSHTGFSDFVNRLDYSSDFFGWIGIIRTLYHKLQTELASQSITKRWKECHVTTVFWLPGPVKPWTR